MHPWECKSEDLLETKLAEYTIVEKGALGPRNPTSRKMGNMTYEQGQLYTHHPRSFENNRLQTTQYLHL